MYNPPLPPQDKVVIIRKHREVAEEIRFTKDLWKQMEFQMELHEQSLEQFVTYAIELYVDGLIQRETNQKKWLDFSDGQFNTHSEPINILHKSDEDIFEDKG